uniref:HDNR domain-containing protein n=1 Tax=Syphacia muris TaxID=451379 RepID=A0A0N5AXH0_9BILA
MFDDNDMLPKEGIRRGAKDSWRGRREAFANPFGAPYVPHYNSNDYDEPPPKRLPLNNRSRFHYQRVQPDVPLNSFSCNDSNVPSSSYTQYPEQHSSRCASQNYHFQNKSRRFIPYQRGNPQPRYGNTRHFSYTPRGFRGLRGKVAIRSDESFNVQDYVIPAMTKDPWLKLKEKFFEGQTSH